MISEIYLLDTFIFKPFMFPIFLIHLAEGVKRYFFCVCVWKYALKTTSTKMISTSKFPCTSS